MRRLALTLKFDGSAFAGWQRQPEKRTVQGVVESALSRICGQGVTVVGCSRLDAGAHARRHVSHFDTSSGLPVAEMFRALGAVLPQDVVPLDLREVSAVFHARKDASLKTYEYVLSTASARPLWNRAYCWHVPAKLDLSAMRRAARRLVGEHDFASFQNAGSSVKTTVRKIESARVIRSGEKVRIRLSGSGFLKQMVRAIVGTLVDVGHRRIPAEELGRILERRRRAAAGRTAPARGLFLVDVHYAH